MWGLDYGECICQPDYTEIMSSACRSIFYSLNLQKIKDFKFLMEVNT